MASNFEITLDRIDDPIVMNLEGDFDATSAYELIYAIKKLPEKTTEVSIHTNGLNDIDPAGMDVFGRFMQDLNSRPRRISITGEHSKRLWTENPPLAFYPCRVRSWW